MSFSCFPPFFIVVNAIATSTVVLSLVYIHFLDIDSSSPGKDRSISARAISVHDIISSGTSTGITNSVRKDEINIDPPDVLVETNPSILFSSATTTRDIKKDRSNIMEREQQPASSFAESQFYARTSDAPTIKRYDFIYEKSDQTCPIPIVEDTFHDAMDDHDMNKHKIIDIESKKI